MIFLQSSSIFCFVAKRYFQGLKDNVNMSEQICSLLHILKRCMDLYLLPGTPCLRSRKERNFADMLVRHVGGLHACHVDKAA